MRVVADAFWLPKRGNSAEEYEDACSLSGRVDEELDEFHCAVGDGATQTIFAGAWARLLVRALSANGFSSIGEALPALQAEWLTLIAGKSLPWYAEMKVQMGACAALAGLTVKKPRPDCGRAVWEAQAVGDSCVFQVRADKLLVRFPLAKPEEFDRDPVLVSSSPEKNNDLPNAISMVCGTWEIDDYFLLMTDAIACWFMKSAERGEKPWNILCDLNTPGKTAPFEEWINDLRNSRAMKNDDVTVLVVNVSG